MHKLKKHITQTTTIGAVILVIGIAIVLLFTFNNSATPFSLSLFPGGEILTEGLTTTGMDRLQLTQSVDTKSLLYQGNIISTGNVLTTVCINVYGISADKPLVMSSRVPIKVISYQPIPDIVDIVGETIGGERPCCFFEVKITPEVTRLPDQTVWATLSSLKPYEGQDLESIDPIFQYMPTEIQNILLGKESSYPHQFILEKREAVVIDVGIFFEKPGIYTLQPGIEYTSGKETNIAWASPSFTVIVPASHYSWKRLTTNYGQNQYYLDSICDYNEKYACKQICTLSANGLSCE
jgi:hypothetical protein